MKQEGGLRCCDYRPAAELPEAEYTRGAREPLPRVRLALASILFWEVVASSPLVDICLSARGGVGGGGAPVFFNFKNFAI